MANGNARERKRGISHPKFHLPGTDRTTNQRRAEAKHELTEDVADHRLRFEQGEHHRARHHDSGNSNAYGINPMRTFIRYLAGNDFKDNKEAHNDEVDQANMEYSNYIRIGSNCIVHSR